MKKVFCVILGVCAGGTVLLCGIDDTLVIGQVDSGKIICALLLIAVLTLMVWGDWSIARSTKGWERRIALTTVVTVELLYLAAGLFFLALGDRNPQYVALPAPEGRPVLVAREESWLLGGWGRFYWQKRPWLLRDTGVDYTTDDGFRPFACGCYELDWGEDSVTVRFSTAAGWDSRELAYPDKGGFL